MDLKELRFEEDDPRADSILLTNDIVQRLNAEECYMIDIYYNPDFSSQIITKTNYVSADIVGGNLSFPCPEQFDVVPQTYDFGFDNILHINIPGIPQRDMDVVFEDDNTLVIDGTEAILVLSPESIFDPNDFTNSDAIFTRIE